MQPVILAQLDGLLSSDPTSQLRLSGCIGLQTSEIYGSLLLITNNNVCGDEQKIFIGLDAAKDLRSRVRLECQVKIVARQSVRSALVALAWLCV